MTNKKNIALIVPKSTFLENPSVWQFLGICYIGARLEAMGHKVEHYDLNIEEFPADGIYDYFFVTCTSPQIREARLISEKTNGWKTKRILGGALAWANPDSCKDLNYDLYVSGEADYPPNMQLILDTIEKFPKIKHLVLLPVKDLLWVLPPIRRWHYKYKAWTKDRIRNEIVTMDSIFGSRGCGFGCRFCESSRAGELWYHMVRYEPLNIIEEQIKQIKENGHTAIGWYDDVFIMNKKRTLEILKLLKKYNMRWRCFMRSDLLIKGGGKEYLKQMVDSGLIEIFVGVESASNDIKKAIYKGTTIEMDTLVLNWCKELDVTCKMSFILGLPSETMETMEMTRQWILKNRPQRVQVDRLIPLPGTPLFDHPEEFDIKYERQPDEEYFYKGRSDLSTHSFVSTSHLTVEQIDKFWINLEKEMKLEGITG